MDTTRGDGPRRSARASAAPSGPWSRGCFVLFVGGLLAYGAALAWHLLDRFDLVDLIYAVNLDDAFYYYQIAWRLAGGEFSTFDGITRTNGYHPIWLFLITPFYWMFDKTEALFAIKAFEIMLVAGGVALVAGAARAARLPWVLLFAALPALYRNQYMFRGMEAAAALFLLGLFLLTVCLYARDPARWRWPLAAVAFALPWVRLEYVAISLASTAALCLVEWSGTGIPRSVPPPPPPDAHISGRASRARRGGRNRWGRSVFTLNAAAPLAGAVAGILVYFTYNAVVFGGVVPVSGATKRWWTQLLWEHEGGYSLTDNFHAFLRADFFDDELLAALEVCVYAGVVWWFSRRSHGREDWLLLAFLAGVSGLAAGHLAKFAQCVLTEDLFLGQQRWHYVPAYLLNAIVVPVRGCVAVWFVRRLLEPGLRRASRVASLGIVTAGAVFLFPAADVAAPFRFVDRYRDLNLTDRNMQLYQGTLIANRVLSGEDVVVGSWDSGAMGYFSRFPVMNLDGLVNSWDYLRARKAGAGTAFLRRHGITHHANAITLWPHDAAERTHHQARYPQASAASGVALFGSSWYMTWHVMRQFQVWLPEWRKTQWSGVDRAEWFWERMAPHLEHQKDGVGLLVDGRMAQAFSRDCAGGLAVWTWTGQEEPVRVPWTQTSTGFCASAVVLPHGALPPVRTATMTADEYLSDRYGERRPAIGADFDVRLVGNRLVYAKESCGRDDVAATFFLHVDPVDPDDLPGPRRRHGFDNLDFGFAAHGLLFKPCVAEVPLPDYGFTAIRTGQYVTEGDGYRRLWEREIRLGSD